MDKKEIKKCIEDGLRKGYSLKNLKEILIENGVKESDAEEIILRKYIENGLRKGYNINQMKKILIGFGFNEKKANKIIEEITGKKEEKGLRVFVIVILFILGIVIAAVGYFAINSLIKDVKLPEITDTENGEMSIDEFSQCRGMAKEDSELCKIQVVASLKNESLCEINLGGKTLAYTWQNEDIHLNLSANDLCWLRISEVKRTNYCSRMNSSQGRDVCSQKMGLLLKK